VSTFDPYHVWLGIPPKEQPTDHYRLLGIERFEPNPDVIANAADQRMAHLRTFQTGKHSADSQRLLNEVAAARICLLSDEKKAAYDEELRRRISTATPLPPIPLPPPPPTSDHPPSSAPEDVELASLFASIARPHTTPPGDAEPDSHRATMHGNRTGTKKSPAPLWFTVAGATAGVLLIAFVFATAASSNRAKPVPGTASQSGRGIPGQKPSEPALPPTPDSKTPSSPKPQPGDHGRGLLAEYFTGDDFSNKVVTRIDPRMQSLWDRDAPHVDVPIDHFKVRWTGYIKAPRPGRYHLAADADDRLTVTIDDTLVCDAALQQASGDVDLSDRPHRILVEYGQHDRSAHAVLTWSLPGVFVQQTIPAEALFHDRSTAERSTVPETALRRVPTSDQPSPAPGQPADLLAGIDPQRDGKKGLWWFDGNTLMCSRRIEGPHVAPDLFVEITVPFKAPTTEYRLTAEVEQCVNHDVLNIGLVSPRGSPTLCIDFYPQHGWRNKLDGVPGGPTGHGRLFQHGRTHAIVCLVRRDGIEITFDGKPLHHWKGDLSSLPEDGRKQFEITSYDTVFRIHKLTFEPLGPVPSPPAENAHIFTPLSGNPGGEVFRDFAPGHAHLVGFAVDKDDRIRGLQPIYRHQQGLVHGGKYSSPGTMIEVVAKDGYAVGKVELRSGSILDGFRVTFMRDHEDRLDPNDAYDSDWIGGQGGNPQRPVKCEGRPAIGVHGTYGDDICSLGLILPAGKAGSPPADVLKTPQPAPPRNLGDLIREPTKPALPAIPDPALPTRSQPSPPPPPAIDLKSLGFFDGRKPENRAGLVRLFGGSDASERAVAMALRWLADHQMPDGGWHFNHLLRSRGPSSDPGSLTKARNAATALALLPFLAAGQTHRTGQYKDTVRLGLAFLGHRGVAQKEGLSFHEEQGTMYSHALVTTVLCEALALTKDPNLARPARAAVAYIVYAQDPEGGGWRYDPRQPGDTSVTGWQLLALRTAAATPGQGVPKRTEELAARFLDSVQFDGGARYRYQLGGEGGDTMAAVGLTSRLYLGRDEGDQALLRGTPLIDSIGPDWDFLYYTYYGTQVMRHVGGAHWNRWNDRVRDPLIKAQRQRGDDSGSWFFAKDKHANEGGRLLHTALATLILESYYRHMPLTASGRKPPRK